MSGATNGSDVILGGSRAGKSETPRESIADVWPVLTPSKQPVQDILLTEILRSPFNRDRSAERKTPEWKEFVGSIRTHGIIQPLVVRPLPAALDPERKPGTPRMELVIGEGRWLGAAEASLATAPCIVRQLTDRAALELQTIENEKRKDLSPLQKAEKYQQLLEQYGKEGLNKEAAMAELCKQTGNGKSTIYEALSLLKLPHELKISVANGVLPPSHAGLLATLSEHPREQDRIHDEIVFRAIKEHDRPSFREVKQMVDRVKGRTAKPARPPADPAARFHAISADLYPHLCRHCARVFQAFSRGETPKLHIARSKVRASGKARAATIANA